MTAPVPYCQWCSDPTPAPWSVYFVPVDGAESPACGCEEHKDAAIGHAAEHSLDRDEHEVRAEWEAPADYVELADRVAGEHRPMCESEWCACGEWTVDKLGWLRHCWYVERRSA